MGLPEEDFAAGGAGGDQAVGADGEVGEGGAFGGEERRRPGPADDFQDFGFPAFATGQEGAVGGEAGEARSVGAEVEFGFAGAGLSVELFEGTFAPNGEQARAVVGKGEREDGVVVALGGAALAAGGDVPDADLAGGAAAGEHGTVRGKGETGDFVGVGGETAFQATPGDFPNFERAIGSRGGEEFAVGREGQLGENAVFAEDGFELAGGDVPDVGGLFLAAGQRESVQREGQRRDGFFVAFKGAGEREAEVGERGRAADDERGRFGGRRRRDRRFHDFFHDGRGRLRRGQGRFFAELFQVGGCEAQHDGDHGQDGNNRAEAGRKRARGSGLALAGTRVVARFARQGRFDFRELGARARTVRRGEGFEVRIANHDGRGREDVVEPLFQITGGDRPLARIFGETVGDEAVETGGDVVGQRDFDEAVGQRLRLGIADLILNVALAKGRSAGEQFV